MVISQLIEELRGGRVIVPEKVLRHLLGGRFPRNNPGYVYVIETAVPVNGVHWVKVGKTKDPQSRLRELNDYEKRGLRNEFHLIAFIELGNIKTLEDHFHKISDNLGFALPEELNDMQAPLAVELLRALAEWMSYSFELRVLSQCPSLRSSRRVRWNAA